MKRAALFLAAFLFGCATVHPIPNPVPVPSPAPVSATPAWAQSLLSLATAQVPDCTTFTWSVTETGGGAVSATGVYTAPACPTTGAFISATYHVVATGCGRTVSIPIDVAETVTGLAITCGSIGSTECCLAPPITVPPGAYVQFYATLSWTCPGHITYSPSQPPAMCTSRVRAPASVVPAAAKQPKTRGSVHRIVPKPSLAP